MKKLFTLAFIGATTMTDILQEGRRVHHAPPVVCATCSSPKGAVPLYDRMMTDGKFIACDFTLYAGKSTIKFESMGEINRIVTLPNKNPTLKFSVEGRAKNRLVKFVKIN